MNRLKNEPDRKKGTIKGPTAKKRDSDSGYFFSFNDVPELLAEPSPSVRTNIQEGENLYEAVQQPAIRRYLKKTLPHLHLI